MYWNIIEKEETNSKGEKEIIGIPILKYYNVFHISQVEGVEPLEKPFSDVQPVENAEQLINDYVARERINYKETISNKGRQSRWLYFRQLKTDKNTPPDRKGGVYSMLLYVMVIQEQHHNKQVNIYKQLKHIGVNVIQG